MDSNAVAITQRTRSLATIPQFDQAHENTSWTTAGDHIMDLCDCSTCRLCLLCAAKLGYSTFLFRLYTARFCYSDLSSGFGSLHPGSSGNGHRYIFWRDGQQQGN